MNLRIILVLLWTMGGISILSAKEPHQKNQKGNTFEVEKQTVTTLQLIETLKKEKALRAKSEAEENFTTDLLFRSKRIFHKHKKSHSSSQSGRCPPRVPPLAVTGVKVPQNPNALPGAFFPDPSASNALVAPPQKIGVTFVAGRQGINPASPGTPPDTCLAVGKTQVVLGDNSGIVTFDKKGNRQDNADTLPNSLVNSDSDFTTFITNEDGRIRFDHHTQRFFVVLLLADFKGKQLNNGISLAISNSDIITPFTDWTVLNIFNLTQIPDTNGCPGDVRTFFDFPCMGIDKNAVYVSFNIFDRKGFFVSMSFIVVQKKSLLENTSAVVTAFYDVVGFTGDSVPIRGAQGTLQPAMNFDKDQKYGYIISTDPTMFGRLIFCRVINPGSKSPSLSPFIPIDVPRTGSLYAPQTDAPFPQNVYGDLGSIEYVDDRLQMAHVINKQLYTTHAIVTNAEGIGDQNGDRLSSRWYQLDVSGDKKGRGDGKEKAKTAPALVQAGTLFDPSSTSPLFYNFPSIMTNKRGDLTLCGTVSSLKQSLSAFFVGRLAKDPKGTLRIGATPPSVYAVGSGTFSRLLGANLTLDSGLLGQRWGDLSYTDLDPEDNLTMWTLQEIAVDGEEVQVVGQLIAP